jgi:hypothetical protein
VSFEKKTGYHNFIHDIFVMNIFTVFKLGRSFTSVQLLLAVIFCYGDAAIAQQFNSENHRLAESSQNRNVQIVSAVYTTGLGLRSGTESGVTLKHHLKNNRALEVIGSSGWEYGGTRITFLYEISNRIKGSKAWTFYYGGGTHLGNYSSRYYGIVSYGLNYCIRNYDFRPMEFKKNYTTFGIDLVIGLEYELKFIPFTVCVDVKPFFDFVNRGKHFFDSACSIRYVF